MEHSESQLKKFKLTCIRYGAKDVSLFEFTHLGDNPLPTVTAGSHVDVTLSNGLIRQYSLITNFCDEHQFTIAVKREAHSRGGSQWLHDNMQVGDILELSEARNLFPLKKSDKPVLLIAGGIGITPIYSMYQCLKKQGKPLELHYWCRSPEHALFYRELSQDASAHFHWPAANAERPSIEQIVNQYPIDTMVYGCGPARMIEELEAFKQDRISVEHFQAKNNASTDNTACTVVLAKSGREVSVKPNSTILEALINEGVDVMYSCEQGICGACEQTVLKGNVIHQDSVLSAEEHQKRKTMMICCSMSASPRLVLDL